MKIWSSVSDFGENLSEFLTYEESEKRLILVGSILALCSLMVSTAFVAIVIRLYGKYTTPRSISYQPPSNSGLV